MNKLGAGVILIALGGIMQCAKVIAAAIYMSGLASQSSELFADGMEYVGGRLDVLAGAAALAGTVLAVWGLWESNKKRKK